jgi:hypothetical protein
VKDARVGFNGPGKDRHFDLDGGDQSALKEECISYCRCDKVGPPSHLTHEGHLLRSERLHRMARPAPVTETC